MDALYEHWGQTKISGATSEDIEVIGLDQAENAIAFGKESGLLNEALAVNLQSEPLSALATEKLTPVDLVMSTGCVGYLTEKSFDRLLPAVTEKLEDQTFFQRDFASDDEQEQVLSQLRDGGVDPTGKEAEGHFLAEFYLSRLTQDVAEMPIERLLPA